MESYHSSSEGVKGAARYENSAQGYEKCKYFLI